MFTFNWLRLFNIVFNLNWLGMVLATLVNLLISFDLINGVLNILKNWIGSHNLRSGLLIFLDSQFCCSKFLCILRFLWWFCWWIVRFLLCKLLWLWLICFRFFQFFLFFPLLEFPLLLNGEITIHTLQILVHLFLCLIVLSLGWLWLYPDVGFLWNVCFFDSSLGLIYGLIGLTHRRAANIRCSIRGSINLLWLLGGGNFSRVYFCKVGHISGDCLIGSCI